MSQQKVDAYKEAKKTRKADVAKAKARKKLNSIVLAAIGVLAAAGLVFGIVLTIHNAKLSEVRKYQSSSFVLTDYSNIRNLIADE